MKWNLHCHKYHQVLQKSNRMPWINSINHNSHPPIMVIMDNNQRSPSVHPPIIITIRNYISNIINKQNNSTNDEHESEIDDTPLLKSPNNKLNNNNPFPLKLSLKSPRIHTKNNTKHAHKSTTTSNINISNINNNIEIDRNDNTPNTPIPNTPNTPIPNAPNTPIPKSSKNQFKPPKINDSDSSFDNYLFAYTLSNKSNKSIHARNKLMVLSSMSTHTAHTDTPISTNTSQIGYKIISYISNT